MERKKVPHIILMFIGMLCLVPTTKVNAQQEFLVNEEKLMLYNEEAGELNLYTERSEKQYRYFLGKNDELVELTELNYRAIISDFTKVDEQELSKIKYDIRSLSQFVQEFNASNSGDDVNVPPLALQLGVWSGVSNFTNFGNNSNTNASFSGIELALFSSTKYSRNVLLSQLRGTFPIDDDLGLEFVELMLGYRFLAVNSAKFNVYIDAELITFGRYKETFVAENSSDTDNAFTQTNTSLGTPIGLGVGAAYALAKDVFITLGYANIVRLGEKTRDDFSIDFRLGLRYQF